LGCRAQNLRYTSLEDPLSLVGGVYVGCGVCVEALSLTTRVQGLGFKVYFQGSGFRVQGSGCRDQGLGFRVQALWSRVWGLGFRVYLTAVC